MKPTGKQVQLACIVAGATVYFFMGALTETGLALQFAVLIGVGVILPRIVTQSSSFAPLLAGDETTATETWDDREYKY